MSCENARLLPLPSYDSIAQTGRLNPSAPQVSQAPPVSSAMIRTTAKPFSFRKIKRQSHRLKTKEHPHGVLNGLRGSSEGIEISHCIPTRTT